MSTQSHRAFQLARELASVRRYSRDYCAREESVLEHTGFCAIYALALAEVAEQNGLKIDYRALLSKAIVHDMEESQTGDIPRPTKYFSARTREAFAEHDRFAAEGIFSDLSPSGRLWHYWETAKDDSLEGRIMKVVDLAAVVYQVVNEMALGNKTFQRVKLEVRLYISETEALLSGEPYPFVFLRQELQSLAGRLEGAS